MKNKLMMFGWFAGMVVVLFVVNMSMSGEWNLKQENLENIPMMIGVAFIISAGSMATYSTTKTLWRKTYRPRVETENKLIGGKKKIDDFNKTKEFGAYIDEENQINRLKIAKDMANIEIDKLTQRLWKLKENIEVQADNKKKVKVWTSEKKMIEKKIIRYTSVIDNKNDRGTKALIYKLSEKYNPYTPTNVLTQTPYTYEKYDIIANDGVYKAVNWSWGTFGGTILLVAVSGFVMKADNMADWRQWVQLFTNITIGFVRCAKSRRDAINYIVEKETPVRMNALDILNKFTDSIVREPKVIEVKEKD